METALPWGVFAPAMPRVLVFPVGRISEASFNKALDCIRKALKGITPEKLGLSEMALNALRPRGSTVQASLDLDLIPVTSEYLQQYLRTQMCWKGVHALLQRSNGSIRPSMSVRASPSTFDESDVQNVADAIMSFTRPYTGLLDMGASENSDGICLSAPHPPSVELLAEEQLSLARNNMYVIGLGMTPGKSEESSVSMEGLLNAFCLLSRYEPAGTEKNILNLSQLEKDVGFQLVLFDKHHYNREKRLPKYLKFLQPSSNKDDVISIVKPIFERVLSKGSELLTSINEMAAIGKVNIKMKNIRDIGPGISNTDDSFSDTPSSSSTSGTSNSRVTVLPKNTFYIYDIIRGINNYEPANILDTFSSSVKSPISDDSESKDSYKNSDTTKKSSKSHSNKKNKNRGKVLLHKLIGKESPSSSISNSNEQEYIGGGSLPNSYSLGHKKDNSLNNLMAKVKSKTKIPLKLGKHSYDNSNESSSLQSRSLNSYIGPETLSSNEDSIGYRSLNKNQSRQLLVNLSHNDMNYVITDLAMNYRLKKLYADCLMIFGFLDDAIELYRDINSSIKDQTISEALWHASGLESLVCAISMKHRIVSKYKKYTGKYTVSGIEIDTVQKVKKYLKQGEFLYRGKLFNAHTRILFLLVILKSWTYKIAGDLYETRVFGRALSLTTVQDYFSKSYIEPENYLWAAVINLLKDITNFKKEITKFQSEGISIDPFTSSDKIFSLCISILENIFALEPRNEEDSSISDFPTSYLYRMSILSLYVNNSNLSEVIIALLIIKLAHPGHIMATRFNSIQILPKQSIRSGDTFINSLGELMPSLCPFIKNNLRKNEQQKTTKDVGKGTSKDKGQTSKNNKQSSSINSSNSIISSNNNKNTPGAKNMFPNITSQLLSSMVDLISPDMEQTNLNTMEYVMNTKQNAHSYQAELLVNRINLIAKMNGISLDVFDLIKDKRKIKFEDNSYQDNNYDADTLGFHMDIPLIEASPSVYGYSSGDIQETDYSEIASLNSPKTPTRFKKVYLQPFLLPYQATLILNKNIPLVNMREDIVVEETEENFDPDDPFLYCDFAEDKKDNKKARIIHPIGIYEGIDVTLVLKGTNALMNDYIKDSVFSITHVEGCICDEGDIEIENGKISFTSIPNSFNLKGTLKIKLMLFPEKIDFYSQIDTDKKYIQLKNISGFCDGDEVVIDLPYSAESSTCFKPVEAPSLTLLSSQYINNMADGENYKQNEIMGTMQDYIKSRECYSRKMLENIPIQLTTDLPLRKIHEQIGNNEGVNETKEKEEGQLALEEVEETSENNAVKIQPPLLIGLTLMADPYVKEIYFYSTQVDDDGADNDENNNNNNNNSNSNKDKDNLVERNSEEFLQESEVKLYYCSAASSIEDFDTSGEECQIVGNKIIKSNEVIKLWFGIWNKQSDEKHSGQPSHIKNMLKDARGHGKNEIKKMHNIIIRIGVKSSLAERSYTYAYRWYSDNEKLCRLNGISYDGLLLPIKYLPPNAKFSSYVIPGKNNENNNQNDTSQNGQIKLYTSLYVRNSSNTYVELQSDTNDIISDKIAPHSNGRCIVVTGEEKWKGNEPDFLQKLINVNEDNNRNNNGNNIGIYWKGTNGVSRVLTIHEGVDLRKKITENALGIKHIMNKLQPVISSLEIINIQDEKQILQLDTSKRIITSIKTDSSIFQSAPDLCNDINVRITITFKPDIVHKGALLKVEDSEQLYLFKQPIEMQTATIETTLINLGMEQRFYLYVEEGASSLCIAAIEWIFS